MSNLLELRTANNRPIAYTSIERFISQAIDINSCKLAERRLLHVSNILPQYGLKNATAVYVFEVIRITYIACTHDRAACA